MTLSADALTKRFADGTLAVDGVSFTVAAGECLAIIGESGCGKTTTLKMLNRLIEPTGGSIAFAGGNVTALRPEALRRRIGWVMQGDGLFPHMTVAENIAVTPRLLGWDKARIDARVDALIEQVRLSVAEHRGRYPAQLSGGQRQRVAIARALSVEPELLLLDEAFGALDPLTRGALQSDFTALRRELGFAAVLVTHDMAEALLIADRILVMKSGRVVRTGTPADLLQDPGDAYVEDLLAMPRQQARAIERLEAGHA
ncbi:MULTISPECIES: ATP-binding cassette domain-containing protein [Hyphobacterium]|uniref:ATP-binding cassette domain-containing protein n=1 Tax=Hyphobacterium vulgare TaxID=1736751 RepID=A0ABV7A0K8_9PROT